MLHLLQGSFAIPLADNNIWASFFLLNL